MRNIIKTKYNGLKEINKGELIVLASRPDVGKTSFAFNVSVNVASQNKNVKIFNFEWPIEKLQEKIDTIKKSYHNKKEIIENHLSIVTNPNLKMDNLIKECKGYDLIIIDSITIISNNNSEELKQIILKLKDTARELNVAIIVISELPRNVDERRDHHPIISDLSEYVINSVDKVIFMYSETLGIIELININLKTLSKEISYLSRSKNHIFFKNINNK